MGEVEDRASRSEIIGFGRRQKAIRACAVGVSGKRQSNARSWLILGPEQTFVVMGRGQREDFRAGIKMLMFNWAMVPVTIGLSSHNSHT